jgi:ornithine cyclodeaminase/alanine dehydrogenase-like protein (mu-crystallin family)
MVVDDQAVVHGDHRRNDADEITVFVSAGLPSADLVVAVLAAGKAGLL